MTVKGVGKPFVHSAETSLHFGSGHKYPYVRACLRIVLQGPKHPSYISHKISAAGIFSYNANYKRNCVFGTKGTFFHARRHVQVSNDSALAFYEKFGFKVVERMEGYYKRIEPADAFVLERRLDEDPVSGTSMDSSLGERCFADAATAKDDDPQRISLNGKVTKGSIPSDAGSQDNQAAAVYCCEEYVASGGSGSPDGSRRTPARSKDLQSRISSRGTHNLSRKMDEPPSSLSTNGDVGNATASLLVAEGHQNGLATGTEEHNEPGVAGRRVASQPEKILLVKKQHQQPVLQLRPSPVAATLPPNASSTTTTTTITALSSTSSSSPAPPLVQNGTSTGGTGTQHGGTGSQHVGGGGGGRRRNRK